MREYAPHWTALVALLVSTTLIASSLPEAFAQDKGQVQVAQNALQIAKDQDAVVRIAMKNTKINTSSRTKFSESSRKGWIWVQTQCADAQSDQCSEAAITMASNQCEASAKFLKKDAKSWQYLSFSLLLASAAFTGLGAASTIAGSTVVPKVFSTLGGTTGLGAGVSSANANVSTDQIGLLSINTTLNQFITYVTTGGTKGAAAVPVFASGLSASGTKGVAFLYQIAATNSPTSYSVAAGTILPAGLTLNAITGVISGTPTAAATTPVTLIATNAVGASSPFTLIFTIAPTPAAGNGPAPNSLIYKVASLYGAQCAATAMASK